MAGHSKWANIKHRKEKADAAKGKVFTRIAKEIINAVKQGGNDPKTNTKLRIAIEKARSVNMPSDNIQRNIKKASQMDQSDYFELSYELYGHGGVGIIVEVMTDNRNRVASELRIATNKKGGMIASPGSVAFNFEQKGIIQISREAGDENTIFLIATEVGAEDFEKMEDFYLITTSSQSLYEVKAKLEEKGISCLEVSLEKIPKIYVECDSTIIRANQELIDFLEELEDVDGVYHNMAPPS